MDYIDLIANVGFPIVVATFVLFRLEASMRKVEDALFKMTEAIIRVESLHMKK